MKAVVLAGGYATRLWPITKHRPKMFLPVGEGKYYAEVRKLLKKGNDVYISTDGNLENASRITEAHDFEIWGVVSHAIHKYI
jgi:glucose-1-phosphate thymidylyltransferase